MENFVGLLYNSGATQEGVGFKNGFGSVYAISGANVIDRCAIFLNGYNNEKILETEGFIFWAKFNILTLSTGGTNLNSGYLFTTDKGTINITPSAFTVQFESSGVQAPYMSLNLGGTPNGWSTIPYRDIIPGAAESNVRIVPSTASTGISSFNLLIFKESTKNFNSPSAFTTYMNNYKKVHLGSTYTLPFILINNITFLFKGGFTANEDMGMNMNIHNFGMSRTNMTAAEFDLFANKMYKYDNYWHLFEGETDTPNINQSDILFYIPMYQKFGGNSSSSTINLMYPKSTTKYAYTTTEGVPVGIAGTSKLNLKLGVSNRWRRPYPPYDPYV